MSVDLVQLFRLDVSGLELVVLIADGVQNGMSGEYHSVTGAAVVAATLLCWDVLLDALAARSKLVERMLGPAPLKLIEDGRMLRRNMRKEFITEDELTSKPRAHGIQDMARVKLACLEPAGELSVITRDEQPRQPPARQHRGMA